METIRESFNPWGVEYQINDKGQKHGLYKSYYANGSLWCECVFIKGKEHGICKTWWNRGMVDCIDTRKNVQHGIRIEFKY